MNSKFNIVLDRPEIPQNTGNIGRLCVGLEAKLHLIGPMGFDIDDKQVKRAGLDYWSHLNWNLYDSWSDWWEAVENKKRVFFFSTKVNESYFDRKYEYGDSFVFGRETKGLDAKLLKDFAEQSVKIPFEGPVRSFNLANSVAMVLGEASRQLSLC